MVEGVEINSFIKRKLQTDVKRRKGHRQKQKKRKRTIYKVISKRIQALHLEQLVNLLQTKETENIV